MRRTACRKVGDLSPDEFGWIEFRCGRREVIDMQARMGGQKILDDPATMDRVLVPNHDDGSWNTTEQMLKKGNDFLARECVAIGLQMQFDLAFPRTDADSRNQVEAFIVLNARANDGRFTARSPRPFEWRDQRKATFIWKNERRAELLPLFL